MEQYRLDYGLVKHSRYLGVGPVPRKQATDLARTAPGFLVPPGSHHQPSLKAENGPKFGGVSEFGTPKVSENKVPRVT